MTVSELALRVLFGQESPPARYWVGLARAGRELFDPGYDRQDVPRAKWKIRGGVASVVVGFGPFENAVEFDQTLLFAEQTLVEKIPIDGGPLRLTAGTFLDHSVQVEFS